MRTKMHLQMLAMEVSHNTIKTTSPGLAPDTEKTSIKSKPPQNTKVKIHEHITASGMI